MTSTPRIRNILFPTDFSELSEHGLQYAIDLGRRLGAAVRLVHVYTLPTYFALPEAAMIPTADFASARSAELQALLERTLADHATDGVSLSSSLRLGVTHDEIVDEARRCHADLIVISSHGHTGLSHLLLGSVAERVVRSADCPVLVVRKND